MHIVKCKGHATWKDIDAGMATFRTMNGNNAADVYAVRGTSVAEEAAPPKGKKQHRESVAYYRFLLTVVGEWVDDATPYDEWKQREAPQREPSMNAYPLHPDAPHAIESRWDRLTCTVCKRFCRAATADKYRKQFYRSECKQTGRGVQLLRAKAVKKTPFVAKSPKVAVVPKIAVVVEPENLNGPIVGTVRTVRRDGLWSDEAPTPDRPDPFLSVVVPRPPEVYGPGWVESRSAKRDAYTANLLQARGDMQDWKSTKRDNVGGRGAMQLRTNPLYR